MTQTSPQKKPAIYKYVNIPDKEFFNPDRPCFETACGGNKTQGSILNYFVSRASYIAEQQKLENCKVISISVDRAEILLTLRISEQTYINCLKALNTYTYINSKRYARGEFEVNFEAVNKGIQSPPEQKRRGRPKGSTKKESSSNSFSENALTLENNALTLKVKGISDEVKGLTYVQELEEKVKAFSEKLQVLEQKVQSIRTFQKVLCQKSKVLELLGLDESTLEAVREAFSEPLDYLDGNENSLTEESIAANIDTSTIASSLPFDALSHSQSDAHCFFCQEEAELTCRVCGKGVCYDTHGRRFPLTETDIEDYCLACLEVHNAAITEQIRIAPSLSSDNLTTRNEALIALLHEFRNGDEQEQRESWQALERGLIESGVLPPREEARPEPAPSEAGRDSDRLQESEGEPHVDHSDHLFSGGNHLVVSHRMASQTLVTTEGDTPHANHPHHHPSGPRDLHSDLEGADHHGQDGTVPTGDQSIAQPERDVLQQVRETLQEDTQQAIGDDHETTRLPAAFGNGTTKPGLDADLLLPESQTENHTQAHPLEQTPSRGGASSDGTGELPTVEPGDRGQSIPVAPVQPAPIADHGAGTMVNGASVTGIPPSQEAPVSPRTDVQASGQGDVKPEKGKRSRKKRGELDEITQKRLDDVVAFLDELKQEVMENPETHYNPTLKDRDAIVKLLLPQNPTKKQVRRVFYDMWNQADRSGEHFWRKHMTIFNVCNQYESRIMGLEGKDKKDKEESPQASISHLSTTQRSTTPLVVWKPPERGRVREKAL